MEPAGEIAVLMLPKFKTEAMRLIGGSGIEDVAEYLAEHPETGDVIPGSSGVRKLRWAAKGRGKRGGARILYVYVVVAFRIYLLRCYAKNEQVDVSPKDVNELRQIAAHLKGAH